jgi:hypothetical protein
MKRINLILLCVIFTITAQAQTNNGTTQQWYYNPETGWHISNSPFYANIRLNGLQMFHTVLESEFYQIMGVVYDSVSYWGSLMYFDRSIVQQAKEISPININRAPKYDYIKVEGAKNSEGEYIGITLIGFSLNTTNFIFNEKIRVGDHIDKLQELGGSTYVVKEYNLSDGYGKILWSPGTPFPSEYKHYGVEVPTFSFNQNGIIISILFYEHGA